MRDTASPALDATQEQDLDAKQEQGLNSKQEQALVVFQHAGEEIRFFKSQQWHVTNYALLAYAALAAAPELMAPGVAANVACAVLVVLVFGAALEVIWSLQKALRKERNRMREARPHLPLVEAIHSKFGRGKGNPIGVFLSAIFIGAVLAIWINLSREGVLAWVRSLPL